MIGEPSSHVLPGGGHVIGVLRKVLAPVASLALLDFSAPVPVGIGGNGTFASTFATDEWFDFSTATAPNNVGSATLGNTGGLLNRVKAGLWNGTTYTPAGAWEGSDSATKYLQCSDSTVGNPGAGDIAARVVYRALSAATDGIIVSKRDLSTGIPGWSMSFNSTGLPYVFIDDGTLSTQLATLVSGVDGAWHELVFWFDASSGDLRLKSDGVEYSTLGTGIGSIDSTEPMFIQRLTTAVAGGDAHIQLAYLGLSAGANAQNFYDEAVVLPGADPTGLLTTQTRAGLISCPADAETVAHFAPNTLPIGFCDKFTDANKLGLLCNSEVKNLIANSEDFTPWTGGTVTVTPNDADSPDRFRSADKLTATATAAPKYVNFATDANTQYTASLWVKRAGATDVALTLRLRDQDIGAASDVTLAITATDTWVPHQVSYTHGATAVADGRVYLHIDVSGEAVYAWGFQINEGDSRAAYVRTSGVGRTLGGCNYEAIGAPGWFHKGAKGEIQATYVGLHQSGPISISYIYEATETGGNNNRRFLWLNSSGGTPQSYGYDSSGSNFCVESYGAQDPRAIEQVKTFRWDGAGGLAIGGGADAETLNEGVSYATDIGTFTGTDSADMISIGSARGAGVTNNFDGFIQRIESFAEEQAA